MDVQLGNRLKVVFAVDAIFPPLTGIGRYALQLARGLPGQPDIGEIRYFSMGRWVADPQSMAASADARVGMPRQLVARARRAMASNSLAVRAYAKLMPPLVQRRLEPYGDFIFHSPNYFLPRFSGLAVATVHDLSIYRYPELHPKARRVYFDLEFQESLKRAAHLITDSEAVRQEVVTRFSWPLERISAVPLGVSEAFFPLSEEATRLTLSRLGLVHGRYGLCVSTLEPRKRIDALIHAYERLSQTSRDTFPLVIVGGLGWLGTALQEQIERASRQGWLRYIGYVEEADLPAIYSGARAFFYPSLYEGFGLPVLEAMSCGIPVLTSDCSSLPEVAGDAGLLVNPDDADALRLGVARILEDEEWRAAAKLAGLRRAAGFSWGRCVERTVAVYRGLLAG